MHRGGFDLGFRGVLEAEFADADAIAGADWRTEDAAGHGTGAVKVADASGRVQDRAGLVVGEILEALLRDIVDPEMTAGGVAGEVWGKPCYGLGDALLDALGAGWIRLGHVGQAILQARGIEAADGEDPMTARGAAGVADKMRAAPASGVGQSGVGDLDQLRVTRG